MIQEQFERTRLLLGTEAMERLAQSHVAVFGVGGVGGHAVEVLARSGVGAITVVDSDRVSLSNMNRQIIALLSTVGEYKVDVAERRIHDINPDCRVTALRQFYLPENADTIDLSQYDYVVDCVDTMKAKLELIRRCKAQGVRIISSMGAANKLDATSFRVSDIEATVNDPLARIIRKRLRKEGISGLKVVWSDEGAYPQPLPKGGELQSPEPSPLPWGRAGSKLLPSNAFVPAAAGLIIGGEVVKDLCGTKNH